MCILQFVISNYTCRLIYCACLFLKFTILLLKGNGLDERFNQTLQHMLVKFISEKKGMWDDFLDTCVYAYNTSVHESTSFTPFEVMFGRIFVLPIDVELDTASPSINDETEALGSDIERLSEQRLKTLTMVEECIH